MALDIGTKRIGVALSDYLQVLATGHSCISRVPEENAINEIKKIAKQNNVEKIIVGVPLNMDGTKGFQADDCLTFARNFKDDFELAFEDERLTSEQAEENLREKKIDFRKNKGLVDIESACIILEQYMGKYRQEKIMPEENSKIIETIDDEGNVVNFELYDIIEFEGKEYALLMPSKTEEDEIVLMQLEKDGDDFLFKAIEDDDEFEKVSEYIESLDEE